MNKLLVTGSSGLVGSACVEYFTKKGWDVTGIDNNQRSKMFGTDEKEIEFPIDIRDEEMVNRLFERITFNAIIHTAGQPSHDWSTEHVLEDFDINARGTLVLLEATRTHCPEATFVYVSTDKVYGENMKGEYPFQEDLGLDFAGVRSFFGCSKTAADIYVQEYGNRFGMHTACFRPGCITGKNHEGAEWHGFLAYLAKCIRTKSLYHIFGDGEQVRDQIHALDLAQAFYLFIEDPKVAAVYNIGGGPERAVSIFSAAKMIEEKTGGEFLHKFDAQRKGDRQWDVHDIKKFLADYPKFKYEYSLADIISDVCTKEL